MSSRCLLASVLVAGILGASAGLAAVVGSHPGGTKGAPSPHWTLDPRHTTIAFSIDATGFPRTDGVFRRFDGSIGIDLDHPARSHIGFKVEAASVDVGSDLLGEMLRGRAFLDAERHADIVFASREVEKVDDHTARITGDLTLLGVTRPLSVDVEVRRLAQAPNVRLAFTAKAKIDRLAFGMQDGYPMISRTVDLVVTSEADER